MSNLDINTPKGRETVKDELRMAELFRRHYVWIRYIHTNKEGEEAKAAIDGVLLSYDNLIGLVETKCRYDFTFEQFKSRYNMEWLVTYEKIVKAEQCAELMQQQLWGFLYIVPSRCLLRKVLWTPKDSRVAKLYTKNTRTQKTVNGGSIIRENAFIDMSDAEIIK